MRQFEGNLKVKPFFLLDDMKPDILNHKIFRSSIPPYQKFFLLIMAPLLVVLIVNKPGYPQNYSVDVFYQDAVPAFLNAATNAVKDVPNKEEIAQWADQTRDRLPEFLNDMTNAMASQVNKPLGTSDISEINDFVAKWQGVTATCPGCVDLGPLVAPIVDNLLHGIPDVRSPRAGDVPLQNLYEFYQQMGQLNPWGLSALFQLEPLPQEIRQLSVQELSKEITQGGIKKIYIVRRETSKEVNNEIVFYELIENDHVVKVAFKSDDVTMMQETLDQLKQHNGDPQVIQQMEQLVSLVNDDLKQAWANGQLDDFTYDYFFNQAPIQNEIIHAKHPLLKDPFIQVYKTAEFYPRTFIVSSPAPVQAQPSNPAVATTQSADQYSVASKRIFHTWFMGFIMPLYSLVLLHFIRGGLLGI